MAFCRKLLVSSDLLRANTIEWNEIAKGQILGIGCSIYVVISFAVFNTYSLSRKRLLLALVSITRHDGVQVSLSSRKTRAHN